MIEFNHVSKKYKIPIEKKITIFETMMGHVTRQMMYEDFYALKDVTFRVEQGEVIGLIGKNGSGKTTLLKILGGVLFPTEGSFVTNGKIAPFLSLGVGFHHELTARENLYLYGAILGMSRGEINKKLSDIFDFAGVGRFKDVKLKNFSTGMIGRLAFSLMIQTDPDILLLDEIFAVGDKDFIPQSVAVLEEYKTKGKTIILASHDLRFISKYCTRVLFLEHGNLKSFGNSDEVINMYLAS